MATPKNNENAKDPKTLFGSFSGSLSTNVAKRFLNELVIVSLIQTKSVVSLPSKYVNITPKNVSTAKRYHLSAAAISTNRLW